MREQTAKYQGPALQCILWCVFVPQTLLLFLNIRGWLLVSGEANASEVSAALTLFTAELVALVASLFIYWCIRQKHIAVNLPLTLIALIAHASYMSLFLATTNWAVAKRYAGDRKMKHSSSIILPFRAQKIFNSASLNVKINVNLSLTLTGG